MNKKETKLVLKELQTLSLIAFYRTDNKKDLDKRLAYLVDNAYDDLTYKLESMSTKQLKSRIHRLQTSNEAGSGFKTVETLQILKILKTRLSEDEYSELENYVFSAC